MNNYFVRVRVDILYNNKHHWVVKEIKEYDTRRKETNKTNNLDAHLTEDAIIITISCFSPGQRWLPQKNNPIGVKFFIKIFTFIF